MRYYIFIFPILIVYITMNQIIEGSMSSKTIGFLGCGKISSAVCRGFASLDDSNIHKPKKILVSRRSEEKSKVLNSQFPLLIDVFDKNEDIVECADIIFIGLLPSVAREILPNLNFENKIVISMMAAVNYEEIINLTKLTNHRELIIRTVPLPSAAKRRGPILTYPCNKELETILSIIGTPIPFVDENKMKTAISVTGQISPFYELLRVTQDWVVKNDIPEDLARTFVASFYSSLAQDAETSNDTFEEMCHEAATPGGLNEQSIKNLQSVNHFEDIVNILDTILQRLRG